MLCGTRVEDGDLDGCAPFGLAVSITLDPGFLTRTGRRRRLRGVKCFSCPLKEHHYPSIIAKKTMLTWRKTDSPRLNALRVVLAAGLLATLIPAGFLLIYGSLVEGGYEGADQSQPYEWMLAASFIGPGAAALAIYGFVTCSRTAVGIGSVGQVIAVLMATAVVLSDDPELGRPSDFDQQFVRLAALVLVFEVVVFLCSWALPRGRTT